MAGVHPITDSNEVKCSLADGGTRQRNGPVQSCSEAPVIQPSVLIKTLCTRSIPVDNRLHSLVEARRVYQRAGGSRQIRDRVRAWGQCAYRGQVEWFKGVSSRTPPGPRKGKVHRCTHTNMLGSHLKGHCLFLLWQEPTKGLALLSAGIPQQCFCTFHPNSQSEKLQFCILWQFHNFWVLPCFCSTPYNKVMPTVHKSKVAAAEDGVLNHVKKPACVYWHKAITDCWWCSMLYKACPHLWSQELGQKWEVVPRCISQISLDARKTLKPWQQRGKGCWFIRWNNFKQEKSESHQNV